MNHNAGNNIDPQDRTGGQLGETPPGSTAPPTTTPTDPRPGHASPRWPGGWVTRQRICSAPDWCWPRQDQGHQAALNGDHVNTCPGGRENDQERALRQMWIRGYSAGRTDLRAPATPTIDP